MEKNRKVVHMDWGKKWITGATEVREPWFWRKGRKMSAQEIAHEHFIKTIGGENEKV